ncbi:MAG: dihydroorotate dehydrogenase electron transfer subunit [Planctomycetota bacterium]
MAAVAPDVKVQKAICVGNRPVGRDALVLAVQTPQAIPELVAGRFFMLRRQDALSPLIPRPFSIYRQPSTHEFEFLVKVHGRGTQALSLCEPGDALTLIGPLGNGWPALGSEPGDVLLVAGGIGSAPFFMAIHQALHNGVDPARIVLVYGGRSADFLYDLDLFSALGVRIVAATDDGSAGFHGNVVQAAQALVDGGFGQNGATVYTCGPDPMMKAVVKFAESRGFPAWVSLETYMGCSVGICNGCAVGTCEAGSLGEWPVAKCCIDGPVFRASDIRF